MKYREEVFVRFRRGLERSRVVSYQFNYQITLAHLKVRYPKIKTFRWCPRCLLMIVSTRLIQMPKLPSPRVLAFLELLGKLT